MGYKESETAEHNTRMHIDIFKNPLFTTSQNNWLPKPLPYFPH